MYTYINSKKGKVRSSDGATVEIIYIIWYNSKPKGSTNF